MNFKDVLENCMDNLRRIRIRIENISLELVESLERKYCEKYKGT